MLCTYTGGDDRMYMDYIDALTGRTLEASPGGGVYDVLVASGRAPGLPLPPGDGRWMTVPVQDRALEAAAPPPWEPAPPVPAAEDAAPDTSEAGDRPADEES